MSDPASDFVSDVPGTGVVPSPLQAHGLTLAYDQLTVAEGLSAAVPQGSFTIIVGPNGCGKSTLLRAFGRTLKPRAGEVLLDGEPITARSGKDVARRLSLLPQTPIAPDAITVRDLVGRGRYPHQGLLRQWSPADAEAVDDALAATGVTDLGERMVSELSGGQRQRVWIAMTLAQQTQVMLLDEPTTFLDVAHQIEILDLCADLHEAGRTVVAVLHDLNMAARYADHLIVMDGGAIVAEGPPTQVLDAALVEAVFGLRCRVLPDPETATPMVVPLARRRRSDR